MNLNDSIKKNSNLIGVQINMARRKRKFMGTTIQNRVSVE